MRPMNRLHHAPPPRKQTCHLGTARSRSETGGHHSRVQATDHPTVGPSLLARGPATCLDHYWSPSNMQTRTSPIAGRLSTSSWQRQHVSRPTVRNSEIKCLAAQSTTGAAPFRRPVKSQRHLSNTASPSHRQDHGAAGVRHRSRRTCTTRGRTGRKEQKKCRQNGLERVLVRSNNAARNTDQTKNTESNCP